MKRCLVLNDGGDTVERTCRYLEAYDFDVNVMSDGEEALSLCEQEMPEVILVEARMPTMTGLQFLERLAGVRRARYSDAPIILFCSDKRDAGAMGAAVWNGASECLMKPFDADILDFKLQQAGAV